MLIESEILRFAQNDRRKTDESVRTARDADISFGD
jgi:hypothetical protein